MEIKKYSLLLVIIPVLLVFLQVISFDFLQYDDTINVSKNLFILNPTAQHILDFWKAPFLKLYIPVTYTAWAGLGMLSLNVFSGRLDPGLFHLLNVLVHILNCVLLYFIIRKLFRLKDKSVNENHLLPAAIFGALIFGLHPVQVETVSWVTGLKGVLSGVFFLCAIYFYLVYYKAERKFRVYAVSTGFMILAVLSMPSAVCLPVMLFFILFWLDCRVTGKTFYPLLPWVVIGFVIVLVTRWAQPMADGVADYPWVIRPFVALDAVMFYAHKILWPNVLIIDYGRTPAYVTGKMWQNLYLWMALPVAGLVWGLRRRPQWVALGLAFVAGLLPVSGLLPFGFQVTSTVADRYLYMSMAVIGVMAAAVLMIKPRPLMVGLCFILVISSGVKSFYQCRQWKDTATIMGHTLEHNPDSFLANLNYGIALMCQGTFKPSIPFYQKALRLRPDSVLAYYNLGLAYIGTGDKASYEHLYQKVYTMDKQKAAKLVKAARVYEKMNASGTMNDVTPESLSP